MLGEKKQEDFLEACQNKLAEYEARRPDLPSHDMIVIDGWQGGGFVMNAALSRQLNAPMLLCMEYEADESPSSCFDRAVRACHLFPNPKSCSKLHPFIILYISLERTCSSKRPEHVTR